MRRFLSLQRFLLLSVCALAALCAYAPRAEAQTTTIGQWWNAGLPRVQSRPFAMPWDPDIQFIIRDGVRGQRFADGCLSLGQQGQRFNDSGRLPVGNGWTLACSIASSYVFTDEMLQGQDGAFYCWRGVATAYRMVGDSRLQLSVTPGANGQPWWLYATASQAFWVQPVSVSGARAWPLWLEVSYQTIDFAPARNASCAGVLR